MGMGDGDRGYCTTVSTYGKSGIDYVLAVIGIARVMETSESVRYFFSAAASTPHPKISIVDTDDTLFTSLILFVFFETGSVAFFN